MFEACVREVYDLHRFFVDWMTGVLPREAEVFRRFTEVMAADFVIIGPRGIVTERDALIDELEAAHGVRAGEPFSIRIDDCLFRHAAADLCLVTYEEWQDIGDVVSGRMSTALLGARDGAPNGVEWRHVHETWLADPGADA